MKFVKKYFLHASIFVFSFLILTKFYFDPDLGLHLAYGNWFLDKGEVLRKDPFTWTVAGYVWVHSYFLYQIIVAYLFRHFGFTFVVILFGLISALAVLIMMPKRITWPAYAATFIGVRITIGGTGIRPHVFDFLLFSLLLVFLKRRLFEKTYFLPVWLLLFSAWVNLHGGYLIGFLVFVCYVILDSLKKRMDGEKIMLAIIVFSIAAAWAGTLITPFGFNLGHALGDYKNLDVFLYIQEFQPLIFFFPLNLLFAVSGIIFIYLVQKTDLGKDFPWMSLGLVLFALPFLVSFLVTFWAAYFIFVCVRYLEFNFRIRWSFLQMVPIIMAVFAVHLMFLDYFLSSTWSLNEEIKINYPENAISFISKNGLGAGLFNDLAWGGYIIWKHPEIKVFIDGRDGWRMKSGKSHLSEYILLSSGHCDLLKTYDVRTALVKSSFKNNCFTNWKEVYTDSLAKVLVRPY
ncbi:MAG: hypothetical protein AAB512_05250 [Patescibacteria group bacterium]